MGSLAPVEEKEKKRFFEILCEELVCYKKKGRHKVIDDDELHML